MGTEPAADRTERPADGADRGWRADQREATADQRERDADDREQQMDVRERALDRWEVELAARAEELRLEDPLSEARDAARSRRRDAHARRRDDADARRSDAIDRDLARADRDALPDPAPGGGSASGFARLASELATSSSLGDLLERILAAALDVVPGCEAASLVMLVKGQPEPAIATAPWASAADAAQLACGSGPLVDALAGSLVRTPDVRTDERWVRLHDPISLHPVRSVLSFPLADEEGEDGGGGGGGGGGVLSVHSRLVDAFGPTAQRIGDVLAAHATIALAHTLERFTHEARMAAQQSALATRDLIGQAKGILMERHGIDADAAFVLLRDVSQARNVKIRDLAEQLVQTRRLP